MLLLGVEEEESKGYLGVVEVLGTDGGEEGGCESCGKNG